MGAFSCVSDAVADHRVALAGAQPVNPGADAPPSTRDHGVLSIWDAFAGGSVALCTAAALWALPSLLYDGWIRRSVPTAPGGRIRSAAVLPLADMVAELDVTEPLLSLRLRELRKYVHTRAEALTGRDGRPRKGASYRDLAIPEWLAEIQDEQLALHDSEYVYASVRGKVLRPKAFRDVWAPARDRIKAGFDFHGLRHTH